MEKSADSAEFWSRRDEAESGDEGEGSSAQDELLEMGQRVEGDDVVQEEVGEEEPGASEGDEDGLQVLCSAQQEPEDVLPVLGHLDIGQLDGGEEGEGGRLGGERGEGATAVDGRVGDVEVGEGEGVELGAAGGHRDEVGRSHNSVGTTLHLKTVDTTATGGQELLQTWSSWSSLLGSLSTLL